MRKAKGKTSESFTIEGVWQRPGETRRTPGTLRFSRNKGLNLSLIIDDLDARPAPGPIGLDTEGASNIVMTGIARDGRRFTLWDGYFRSGNPWSHFFKTVGQRDYLFNWGLEGICADDPSKIRFPSATVRIENLANWLGQSNFEVTNYPAEEPFWAMLRCKRLETIKYRIQGGPEVQFGWTCSGPEWGIFQTSGTIKSEPYLRLVYADAVNLADCQRDIDTAVDLIQLLSGRAVAYGELFLSPSASNATSDTKSKPQVVRFLGSRRMLREGFKPHGAESFLFHFPQIQARFGDLLERWWQLYSGNHHVLMPYSALKKWQGTYANEQFFMAATVAEAVHGFLNPGLVSLTKEQWKAVRHALENALPQEHRKKLLPKLAHLPQLTFAERMELLISALQDDIRQIVIGEPSQQDRFIRRVKQLRNAEAHRLNHETSGIELIRLASKLRVIIDWALLEKLGFDGGEIAAAMKKCMEYFFYASSSTWPWDIAES